MQERLNKKSKAVQPADEPTTVTQVPGTTKKLSEEATVPPVPSAGMITSPSGPPASPRPGDFVMEPGIPPELAGHPDYEVIRLLGRGDMGVVYLAKNRIMGRGGMRDEG
jgi:hypothetical protein